MDVIHDEGKRIVLVRWERAYGNHEEVENTDAELSSTIWN